MDRKRQPKKFENKKMKTHCGKNNLLVRVYSISRAIGDVFHSDGNGSAARGSRVREEDTSALGGCKDVEVRRIRERSYEGTSSVAAGLVVNVDGVDGECDAGRVSASQIVNLKNRDQNPQ